jgi:DNA-binding NarL/FixJ family response regulator
MTSAGAMRERWRRARSDMISSSALDAGREAAAERRWAAAYELLGRADATEVLAASDLELLSTVALLRGEPSASVDALSRAYEAHLSNEDRGEAARTAGRLALYLIELGDFSRSVVWAARAMRLVNAMADPGALAGFVRLGPAVAQLGSGNPAEARQEFEDVLALAERHGDAEIASSALLGLGKALIEVGAIAEGFECFDRAMTAVAAGDVAPVSVGVISCALISDAVMAFDLERAAEWTTVLDRWCRGQPELITFSGQCHALRASLLLIRGAWAEASAVAELALSRFRAGDYRAVWGAPYQLAELGRLRGAFHSAEENYRRAGESGWEPQPGLALLHLAVGRTQYAQDEIRRTVAGSDPFTRRFLLPALVEIEVAAGDLDAARRAVAELRESSRSLPTPMLDATVAAAEARVQLAGGGPLAGLRAARAAVAAWDVVGASYETARMRVLAGRALLELSERDAAETEFQVARQVFAALGADPAVAELDGLSGDRRAGVLTPREVEVLRLVSTGLTNRAIGTRLSLSEKTVARHLSNIFGKLGISSRSAATAYAYENGLV